MEHLELEETFGAPALIQLRDLIGMAVGGDVTEYAPLNMQGTPEFAYDKAMGAFRPVGARRPSAMVDRVTAEGESKGDPVFSFFIRGIVLPAKGGRVQISYERNDQLITAFVHPRDILAVTIVSEKPGSGGLIRQP